MAVIINEFEVVAEPLPAPEMAGATPATALQRAQEPPLTPEIIRSIWRRELDRCARVYAG
jgi:hypothetical protein